MSCCRFPHVRTALYGVLGVDLTEIHGLPVARIEAYRRLRHGPEGMAERQALHLLALPRTWRVLSDLQQRAKSPGFVLQAIPGTRPMAWLCAALGRR